MVLLNSYNYATLRFVICVYGYGLLALTVLHKKPFGKNQREINAKKFIAVKNATYAVAKRKPGKIQECRVLNPYLCDSVAALSPIEFTGY